MSLWIGSGQVSRVGPGSFLEMLILPAPPPSPQIQQLGVWGSLRLQMHHLSDHGSPAEACQCETEVLLRWDAYR